jgi:hypothetical protein
MLTGGLHLSEEEKEKWFGNGRWAVESIRCWVGLDPLAPFPFFFFFLLFFLFLFFLYNFCINPPNKVKSMSKIF